MSILFLSSWNMGQLCWRFSHSFKNPGQKWMGPSESWRNSVQDTCFTYPSWEFVLCLKNRSESLIWWSKSKKVGEFWRAYDFLGRLPHFLPKRIEVQKIHSYRQKLLWKELPKQLNLAESDLYFQRILISPGPGSKKKFNLLLTLGRVNTQGS